MVIPADTATPCSTKFTYSPSSNLSAMSFCSAAIAASASSPCASMSSEAPLPAASIITPMMLLAFTRRPLRASQISQAKPLASCVSLAEARACSPSLLTIWTSAVAIPASVILSARIRAHVYHALGAARKGLFDHRGELLVAVGERADQHRQVDPGDALDPAGLEQAQRDVARGGAEDVGEHEHAVAVVELRHEVARLRQDRVGLVVHGDADLAHAHRPLAERVARRVDERLAEGAVRDDEDADHAVALASDARTLRSSASMKVPETSKPVWSWISRKQVGLVTFTSVRQSPITSSPTSSRPRAASTGPSASAISRSRADSGRAMPRPPAARLARVSPDFAILASACGTGLPSISSTRL